LASPSKRLGLELGLISGLDQQRSKVWSQGRRQGQKVNAEADTETSITKPRLSWANILTDANIGLEAEIMAKTENLDLNTRLGRSRSVCPKAEM